MAEQISTEQLRAKVENYIASDPDNAIKLEAFLNTSKLLYDTDEVMIMTGWSKTHLLRLCRSRKIPHIPGNPNKFMLAPLMRALEAMSVGGHGESPRARRAAKIGNR